VSTFRASRIQARPPSVKPIESPTLAIVGFTWGGWVTDGKADVLARLQVQAALVEVLTPICIDKFNKAMDAPARLVELKKSTSSWDRERFVRKNDWAKFGNESNSRVVDACAAELYKL
jgi:alpha/beta superfamily hydrolase